MTTWSPLDDPRVAALAAWARGDAGVDIAAALASLQAAPPRPDCAAALGLVASKAYERVPGVGPRSEAIGGAVVEVLGGLGRSGERALAQARDRTTYTRARLRIEAALANARRDARRGRGEPTIPRRANAQAVVDVGSLSAVIEPSPNLRRTRTSWLAPDGRHHARRPRALGGANSSSLQRVRAERALMQSGLTQLRAEIETEMLRGAPLTADDWLSHWMADPLRAEAARRMIWTFDGAPGLPAAHTVAGVEGRPIAGWHRGLISLWHPANSTPQTAGSWAGRLDDLGIIQPVEQARREVIAHQRFTSLCSEIGWLDQSRMRAFLRRRGWHVPWLGGFDTIPEARRELLPGGPHALLELRWRETDARVTPVRLTIISPLGAAIPHPLPAWPSEAGRDLLGAAAAAA